MASPEEVSEEASPSRAIAEVSAVSRQSQFMRHARRWPLLPSPTKILIGSEAACDWVVPGPNILPRECLLRWDGQLLIASSFGERGGHEIILEPNAPLRVGALELLFTPLAAGPASVPRHDGEDDKTFLRKPAPRHDEPTQPKLPSLRAVAMARINTTSGEFSAAGPTQIQVPAAEPTVLIDATLVSVARRLPPRRRRLALRVLCLGLMTSLVIVAARDRHMPWSRAKKPVAPPRTIAPSPSPPPTPPPTPTPTPTPIAVAPIAPVAIAPKPPAPPSEKTPPATVETTTASVPDKAAFERIGAECRPLPATAHASPEEHALLQLAIEAYQNGHRTEAQQLFKALVCRPDVGPPARFMARLLVASTPAPLPRDRGLRTRRLLDETARELEEHPDVWAQSESLGGGTLENPKLSPFDFKDQPKCNIFIGEMLFRAGFIPPGAPAPGQLRVNYPSVNQMVARAEKLAHDEPWDAADGLQWFDVVPKNAAEPGDLVLIAARDRGDRDAFHTEHGHVEIISQIVYEAGSIKSVSTVGARSHGVKLSPGAGRVFGEKLAGNYQFSQFAMLVRPRMR